MSQLNHQAEIENFPSSTFCSIQDSNKLGDAHPHWGGKSFIVSLHIQMLISSGNTTTDIPRNNV